MNAKNLAAEVLAGNRLALARLLTRIENEDPTGLAALDLLFVHTGQAHLVGVTGSPGAGKSSLVNQLALLYRSAQLHDGGVPGKVAIIAVDPSSPFSGGAVLGDRVRMRDLSGDTGVFIRSMASRGALGGLARATAAAVQALDAAGFDLILIETVGAGQAEVDIARLAHTTLLVEAPGMGDDIQAIKAGILEIADVIVINKADRPGAEVAERVLRAALDLGHPAGSNPVTGTTPEPSQTWVPPILKTVATEAKGIGELAETIQQHAVYLRQSGAWAQRDRARLQAELDQLVHYALVRRWQADLPAETYRATLEQLTAREISPRQAMETLLESRSEINTTCK